MRRFRAPWRRAGLSLRGFEIRFVRVEIHPSGNHLDAVVLVTVEGDEPAIHAMAMRAKCRRLLEQ